MDRHMSENTEKTGKNDIDYPFVTLPGFKVGLQADEKTKIVSKGILAPVLGRKTAKEADFFDNRKYVAKAGKRPGLFDASEWTEADDSLIFSTWMPPIPSPAYARLVKSRMTGVFGKFNPEQMTISITEECPNHCIHCALPDKRCHSKLTVDETKTIIDEALEMGVTYVIFDGGEPLTYDGLEELIAAVDPKKAIAGMFTSGVGMTPEKAQALKKAGLYSVTFSFDHASPEKHDLMRGKEGVFEAAVNGVRYALDAGLLVNIYNVLGPHNIGELDDLFSLASDLGVHELSFYEIVPTGRWLNRPESVLSEKDHETFRAFLKKHENDVSGKENGPRLFPGPVIVSEMGCMAGRQWIHITPEGDILPCSCIPVVYGNTKSGKGSLRAAWKKIRSDRAYSKKQGCLMRDPEFRRKYIRLD